MRDKKYIKRFNESTEENLEALTIQEFVFLREAMYAVKDSKSPSAFQAKEFFKNEENFKLVIEKLRKLSTYSKIVPPSDGSGMYSK